MDNTVYWSVAEIQNLKTEMRGKSTWGSNLCEILLENKLKRRCASLFQPVALQQLKAAPAQRL